MEKDLLPVTEKAGMGVLPWSPLAGCWLSGRCRTDQDVPTADVLDAIVPPGVTRSQFDGGYVPPSLQGPFRRRRRTA